MTLTRCLSLCGLAAAASLVVWPAAVAATTDRPNVVLIMADDFGYECLGANGCLDYQTPQLDRLAAGGVRFEQFHAQPLCTPTRVKLMTGQSNRRNYKRFGLLPRDQVTFAQLFRDAGYRTCIAGKWQLGRAPDGPRHFGFEQALLWQHTRPREAGGHDTRYSNPQLELNGKPCDDEPGTFSTDLFCTFLEDFLTQHRDEPCLVYFPMVLTHCPFSCTPDSADWDPTSPGSTSYEGDARHFADMVHYVDKTVGRIDAHLQRLGLREKTLLIFIGDNGTDKPIVTRTTFGEVAGGKGLLTDAGTRVPCVVSWPGAIRSGHVVPHASDVSDMLPTLCEAAGIAPPVGLPLDGASLLANLKGDPEPHREAIHIWYARNGKNGRTFVRTADYKLYDDGRFYQAAVDPLEQHALVQRSLTPEAATARGKLMAALDRFSQIPRPGE